MSCVQDLDWPFAQGFEIMLPYHLRIFLESHCNFRCIYCNPDAHRQDDRVITNEEIIRFLCAAQRLGIERVHYSGGEPTLRRQLTQIMSAARAAGFVDQSMTTNGVLLAERLRSYTDAGLTQVNISIDSLDRDRFRLLTGRDDLALVKTAIERSAEHFDHIKINIVVLDENIIEIPDFILWAKSFDNKIICRFIELQSNQPIFFEPSRISPKHVPATEIYSQLKSLGHFVPADVTGKNPNCSYFMYEGIGTSFGVIANQSRGYPCGGCRKLRLSPYGDLGVCITAEGRNIRHLSVDEMVGVIKEQLHFRDELDLVRPDRKHLSSDYGFWRWGDLNPDNTTRPIAMTAQGD